MKALIVAALLALLAGCAGTGAYSSGGGAGAGAAGPGQEAPYKDDIFHSWRN